MQKGCLWTPLPWWSLGLCIPQDETQSHLPITPSFRNLETNQGSSFRHPRISKEQKPTAFLETPCGTNILIYSFPSLAPSLPFLPKSKYPRAYVWSWSEWKMVPFLAGRGYISSYLGFLKVIFFAPTLLSHHGDSPNNQWRQTPFGIFFFWLNLNVLFWSERSVSSECLWTSCERSLDVCLGCRCLNLDVYPSFLK